MSGQQPGTGNSMDVRIRDAVNRRRQAGLQRLFGPAQPDTADASDDTGDEST